MHTFELETLHALSYACLKAGYKPVADINVHDAGRRLLSTDWGGDLKHGKSGLRYSPRVSMSLGKLVKCGLCEKHDTSENFHLYMITPEGSELLNAHPQYLGSSAYTLNYS